MNAEALHVLSVLVGRLHGCSVLPRSTCRPSRAAAAVTTGFLVSDALLPTGAILNI